MLSRVKIGLSDIRRALLELDDQKLSVDDLRAISRQLPTSEEVRTIEGSRPNACLTVYSDHQTEGFWRPQQVGKGRSVLRPNHDHPKAVRTSGVHAL